MAKRKSRKPMASKARKEEPLATIFSCPYCQHVKAVKVYIHKKENWGRLSCGYCAATFTCKTGTLSLPVDVYAQWIDEFHAVNKQAEEEELRAAAANRKRRPRPGSVRVEAEPDSAAAAEEDMGGDDDEEVVLASVRRREKKRQRRSEESPGEDAEFLDDILEDEAPGEARSGRLSKLLFAG